MDSMQSSVLRQNEGYHRTLVRCFDIPFKCHNFFEIDATKRLETYSMILYLTKLSNICIKWYIIKFFLPSI